MNRTACRLIDPTATRTGQVHFVTFAIEGESATVTTDDCVMPSTRRMTREEARAEYRKWLARGFRAAKAA